MDQINEIRKLVQESKEKYTYYIIGINVAAIGFSVHQTLGIALSKSQWLLGCSILFWGTSIFLGLWFLRIIFKKNLVNASILPFSHKEFVSAIHEIDFENKPDAHGYLERLHRKANQLFSIMNFFLYLGIVSFIGWRVYEMYLLSINNLYE